MKWLDNNDRLPTVDEANSDGVMVGRLFYGMKYGCMK